MPAEPDDRQGRDDDCTRTRTKTTTMNRLSELYDLDELTDHPRLPGPARIDRSGAPSRSVATVVRDDEVCATTPTVDLVALRVRVRGLHGQLRQHAGSLVPAGAVVVWPTRPDFEVRAEASPQWALDTLAARSGTANWTAPARGGIPRPVLDGSALDRLAEGWSAARPLWVRRWPSRTAWTTPSWRHCCSRRFGCRN